MANEIGKLFVVLGLDDKDLARGLQKTMVQLKEAGKIMTGIGATITAGLGLSIKTFAETGSEIYDMSLKTGFGAEALSGLKYAAEQSGASLETVGTAIKGMSNFMQAANQKTGASAATLKQLGLSLEELQ